MARRTIANKRIIITGASSGIGQFLAERLAEKGARILICARREERLSKLSEELKRKGQQCRYLAGDVTDPSFRSELLNAAQKELGGIDVLVNNAGAGAMGRFDEAAPERLRQVFEVNFFAPAELMRICLPALKTGVDPLIVNIGSVLGHRAAPLKSEYCASKFALHGLSDALRAELSLQGIELLLVNPSTTSSEFFDRAIEDTSGKTWVSRGAMSADQVAQKTIAAMERRKHEIVLTWGGKLLVWLDRLLPGLANRMVARYGQ